MREVFVRLYEKGLIYRGKYIINWCPRCLTALSNEEVEKEETDGRIWRFRYPLADGSGHITVATTRPETILGDTAVAVHPDDARYVPLIGKTGPAPAGRAGDSDRGGRGGRPDFGTGAVKVTPAHDPLDFEIGQRHRLESIDIMTPEARIRTTPCPSASGVSTGSRRASGSWRSSRRLGLLDEVEDHRHAVGHCYRCDTVVEPRLSDQWFVKMAPLAKPALAGLSRRPTSLHSRAAR